MFTYKPRPEEKAGLCKSIAGLRSAVSGGSHTQNKDWLRLMERERNGRLGFTDHAWSLVLILYLIFPAMGGCDSPRSDAENVISVGSTNISAEQLREDLKFVSANARIRSGENIKMPLVQEVINYYLILEYARKNGVTVPPREAKEALAALKGEYRDSDFHNALLKGYLKEEEWEKRVKERLLVQKAVEKALQGAAQPDAQEIKAYFQAHKDEFRSSGMVKFRQIVSPSKDKAAELLQRLEKGKSIKELARSHSIAPEAAHGGLVDWVEIDRLEHSMADALCSLKEGEISQVVKTPYGYHIFKLISIRPGGARELPEVMHEIEARLLEKNREKMYKRWLKELRNRYEVRVDYQTIKEMEF